MKIFFGVDIKNMDPTIKFVADNGDFVFSVSQNCNDQPPFYGFELSDEKKLKLFEYLKFEINGENQ